MLFSSLTCAICNQALRSPRSITSCIMVDFCLHYYWLPSGKRNNRLFWEIQLFQLLQILELLNISWIIQNWWYHVEYLYNKRYIFAIALWRCNYLQLIYVVVPNSKNTETWQSVCNFKINYILTIITCYPRLHFL